MTSHGIDLTAYTNLCELLEKQGYDMAVHRMGELELNARANIDFTTTNGSTDDRLHVRFRPKLTSVALKAYLASVGKEFSNDSGDGDSASPQDDQNNQNNQDNQNNQNNQNNQDNNQELESGMSPRKDRVLIVTAADLSKTVMENVCRTVTNNLWAERGIFVSIMPLNMLGFRILSHELVPPHRIMSDDEASAMLSKHDMTVDQLPMIDRFDPVAIAIGMKPGQICEITRKSATAIVSIYYRHCVMNV